ncbi:MAG: tetratricopeptide repeat protein [Anaerolineae bacterium]
MDLAFGPWLKQRRRALNLTQEDLAQQAACSIVTVRKIESGDLRPSQDLALQFARALGIPEEEHAAFVTFARAREATQPATAFTAAPAPPAPAAPTTRPYHLPAQLTAALGRERDTLVACSLLRLPNVRLVTLTGPPGTGKTRLSLEIAEALQDEYEQGACFVPLAPLDHPRLVEPAIAQALDVREAPQHALHTTLAGFLRDNHLLLVLDNFEHLLSAAPVVAELLAHAPRLKVLVSSREPLRVYGERELPVSPLGLPELNPLPPPEELLSYAAIAVFVERAQAVKPDFQLTAENGEAVAQICASLDGLPLAIEMAAARVKWYPPQVLLGQLQQRLASLASNARDRTPRQQTLHGAIEWSYNLLLPEEQRLFDRLGVFAGGLTPQAAQAVTGASPESLLALADKSLLKYATPGPEPRLFMLRILRAYALERLQADPAEQAAAGRAHAKYYLALAESTQAEASPERPVEWLDRLEAEHDNLRAALTWALAQEVSLGVRLTLSLGRFWYLRGHFSEGRVWQSAALPHATDEQRLMLLRQLGETCWNLGALPEAQAHLEACVQLARALTADPSAPLADALNLLGRVLKDIGLYSEAKECLEEGLALARRLPGTNAGVLIPLLRNLGNISIDAGRFADAERYFSESLALARRHQDRLSIAAALNNLGIVHIELCDYDAAEVCLNEARSIFEADGYPFGTAMAAVSLGRIAHQRGDYEPARRDFETSLRLARELGKKWSVAYALSNLGLLACDMNEWDEGERYFRGAMQAALEAEARPRILDVLSGYARCLARQGQMERAIALLGLVMNHPASEHEASERARGLLARWRTQLPAEAVAAALARGQAWAQDRPEAIAAELTTES